MAVSFILYFFCFCFFFFSFFFFDSIDIPSVETHVEELMAIYQSLLAQRQKPAFSRLVGTPKTSVYRTQTAYLHTQATVPLPPSPSPSPPPSPSVPPPLTHHSAPWRITFDTNPDDCNLRCIMCEEHSIYSKSQEERKACMFPSPHSLSPQIPSALSPLFRSLSLSVFPLFRSLMLLISG